MTDREKEGLRDNEESGSKVEDKVRGGGDGIKRQRATRERERDSGEKREKDDQCR